MKGSRLTTDSIPRRLTLLLFALFVVIATVAGQTVPNVMKVNHQRQLPDVIAPTGELADLYEELRPATLKIEARVDSTFLSGPLGIGTGFFISPDGLLLTAYHVVDITSTPQDFRENLEFVAVSPDGTEYSLSLVGFDIYFDLALLKADVQEEVPYLPLAQEAPLIGSNIVAIGNSRDDFLEARAGRVLKIGVDSPRVTFADDTIQLTAALAPGDSGGPVINDSGEAIGVVSYIAFNPDQNVPLYLQPFINEAPSFASYAAPVTVENEVIEALMRGERRDVPVIGFSAGIPNRIPSSYDPEDIRFPDLGELPGVIVGRVQPNGPASAAGFKDLDVQDNSFIADVIVAVDDEPTIDFPRLLEVLYQKGVGQTVTVTVQRGTKTFKLRLELGAKREVFN